MIEGRPDRLVANAWTGTEAASGKLDQGIAWGLQSEPSARKQLLAPPIVDERDWRHPEVGWGLVLPDRDDLPDDVRASGEDAPEAVRRLLASRPASVVLRYRPELLNGYLRRYYGRRGHQDLSVAGSARGVAEGHLPLYLLILASPAEIPWSLQYVLNISSFVGRLDPTGAGWENYIEALISGWSDADSDPHAPLVWSVDHGGADITRLMATVVAEKLWQSFAADPDAAGRRRLHAGEATAENLAEALNGSRPGFIVTTSHGMTGPLDQAAKLVAQLGLPVDAEYKPVDAARLVAHWSPGGTIWYSHACCSAGSDAPSRFADLFESGDPLQTLLGTVSDLAGARVAPLPRALLGASRPARAFIGHVEPTFDWTLRDPTNRQVVSHALVEGLYRQLFRVDAAHRRATPVGYAMRRIFIEAGEFFASWQQAMRDVDAYKRGAVDTALYRKLVALDRQSIVILGDPTVSLPLAENVP